MQSLHPEKEKRKRQNTSPINNLNNNHYFSPSIYKISLSCCFCCAVKLVGYLIFTPITKSPR